MQFRYISTIRSKKFTSKINPTAARFGNVLNCVKCLFMSDELYFLYLLVCVRWNCIMYSVILWAQIKHAKKGKIRNAPFMLIYIHISQKLHVITNIRSWKHLKEIIYCKHLDFLTVAHRVYFLKKIFVTVFIMHSIKRPLIYIKTVTNVVLVESLMLNFQPKMKCIIYCNDIYGQCKRDV